MSIVEVEDYLAAQKPEFELYGGHSAIRVLSTSEVVSTNSCVSYIRFPTGAVWAMEYIPAELTHAKLDELIEVSLKAHDRWQENGCKDVQEAA